MALVPSLAMEGALMSEIDMGGVSDSSAAIVRATVVQASTVFYDTPATLGIWHLSLYPRLAFLGF